MNLRPFNLEEALNGEPVVDCYGDEIKDFHIFKEDPEHVYAWDVGAESVMKYTKDGYISTDSGDFDTFRTLRMAPKQPRKYYVNVYRNDAGLPTFGAVYPNKEAAKRVADCTDMQDYVSTIEVEV